jgi:hypothetical protein
MDSSNTLLFEMRVLNELRKLKPEQRKELVDTLEREEKLEEEALKKNPNLHVENKIQQVLTELKELRNEIHVLKANSKNTVCTLSIDNLPKSQLKSNNCCWNNDWSVLDSNDDTDECSLSSIDWWPIVIFILIFLLLVSLPAGNNIKGYRPNPLVL